MAEYTEQDPAPGKEFDFTIEAVILFVLSVFMLLFGILLFAIHTGTLPYTPDSTYGLFLVIVALQVITMGKTPFGDVRRSGLVIIIGIAAAVIGMGACFVPGALTSLVRTLVGVILTVGGAALLVRLILHREKATAWLEIPGILRHITLASALVYIMAFLLGLVTLLPALTTDTLTTGLLIIDGASLLYLAWSIRALEKIYPKKAEPVEPERPHRSFLSKDAPLPLTTAILIFLGVLLAFLAVLLVPVNLGTLPFSPDGQLGLLLVIMAIQVLAMGETPVGQFRRSRLLVLIGLVFAGLGIFSCIVPGILTDDLRVMLGLLNLAGGIVPLVLRFYPLIRQMKNPPATPVPVPPQLRNLLVTQTVLNIVGILFGASMLLPGFIPGMVTAAILFCNGLLLFVLAYILSTLPAPE
ncbi:MAG: hypothetical protein PHD55_03965 [Methanoregula sp.]|nr:hypothetical protein [Methanoregula sp.]